MEQVKIFAGVSGNGAFEQKVNTWLTENASKVKITRVVQSSATSGASGGMSDILHLTIFYRWCDQHSHVDIRVLRGQGGRGIRN